MCRVLVVEDHLTEAQELADALTAAGYEVAVADDAPAARYLLGLKSFDVLLCDLQLPDGAGFELCRHVKNDPHWDRLVVVVHARQADPVQILRGLEAGADGYLSKDCPTGEMVAAFG